MSDLKFHPFRFESIFKEKVWGGRDLETHLGKILPPNTPVGESWDVCDRDDEMSIVAWGPHKGESLRALLAADRRGMLGPQIARLFPDRFPLLVKYIDAHDILSLQVHPGDDYAMEHENGQWGKMEAWYIVGAQPGSFIYRGLKPGTDRNSFRRLLGKDRLHECLNKIHVSAGDVIFIPPGCLHATGAGILSCEIQQNSDLTYRVYDWGRMGLDGTPRELHLEKALEVIDWDLLEREELGKTVGMPTEGASTRLLLECPKFAIERVMLKPGDANAVDVSQRFHVVCVIEGHGTVRCPQEDLPPTAIRKGETYLIPSALTSYEILADDRITALRCYLPLPGD
ncbi:MAG: class I mannose-6-phosphate isomerase [Planctomycetes bacterium]|nr:class I mannose-6-phosphate isomerase [Planctomycetota bacterium]